MRKLLLAMLLFATLDAASTLDLRQLGSASGSAANADADRGGGAASALPGGTLPLRAPTRAAGDSVAPLETTPMLRLETAGGVSPELPAVDLGAGAETVREPVTPELVAEAAAAARGPATPQLVAEALPAGGGSADAAGGLVAEAHPDNIAAAQEEAARAAASAAFEEKAARDVAQARRDAEAAAIVAAAEKQAAEDAQRVAAEEKAAADAAAAAEAARVAAEALAQAEAAAKAAAAADAARVAAEETRVAEDAERVAAEERVAMDAAAAAAVEVARVAEETAAAQKVARGAAAEQAAADAAVATEEKAAADAAAEEAARVAAEAQVAADAARVAAEEEAAATQAKEKAAAEAAEAAATAATAAAEAAVVAAAEDAAARAADEQAKAAAGEKIAAEQEAEAARAADEKARAAADEKFAADAAEAAAEATRAAAAANPAVIESQIAAAQAAAATATESADAEEPPEEAAADDAESPSPELTESADEPPLESDVPPEEDAEEEQAPAAETPEVESEPESDDPPPEETEAPLAESTPPAVTDSSTTQSPSTLTHLKGVCSEVAIPEGSWWTWEICHWSNVSQFHLVEQDDTLVRQADMNMMVGTWHSSSVLDEKSLLHTYETGTVCDVTGMPRRAHAKYMCGSQGSELPAKVVSIAEPRPCEYAITVHVPKLCAEASLANGAQEQLGEAPTKPSIPFVQLEAGMPKFAAWEQAAATDEGSLMDQEEQSDSDRVQQEQDEQEQRQREQAQRVIEQREREDSEREEARKRIPVKRSYLTHPELDDLKLLPAQRTTLLSAPVSVSALGGWLGFPKPLEFGTRRTISFNLWLVDDGTMQSDAPLRGASITRHITQTARSDLANVTPNLRITRTRGSLTSRFFLEAPADVSSRSKQGKYSTHPAQFSTWLHIALTIDSDIIFLFVDGVEQAQLTISGDSSTSSAPLTELVSFGSGEGAGAAAVLDNICVYNTTALVSPQAALEDKAASASTLLDFPSSLMVPLKHTGPDIIFDDGITLAMNATPRSEIATSNRDDVLTHYLVAHALGCQRAHVALGHRYRQGVGGVNSAQVAAHYLIYAAEKALDDMIQYNVNTTLDTEFYLHAAPVFSVELQRSLNVYGGVFGERDPLVKSKRRLAEAGDANAQFWLAKAYYWGRGGMPINFTRALRHNRMAASQKHADALQFMAILYAKGHGVAVNNKIGLEYSTKAAKLGNTAALNTIGYYHERQGDYITALKNFKKAAGANNSYGHYNIALLYSDGLGTLMQDSTKALKHYRAAADLGHPSCLLMMGLYQLGLTNSIGDPAVGLKAPRDIHAAVEYLHKLASIGDWGGVRHGVMEAYLRSFVGDPKQRRKHGRKFVRVMVEASELGYTVGHANLGWAYESALETMFFEERQTEMQRSSDDHSLRGLLNELVASMMRDASREQHRFRVAGGGIGPLMIRHAVPTTGYSASFFLRKSVELYTLAARNGDSHAALRVGDYYCRGGLHNHTFLASPPRNYSRAAEFYALSAQLGAWQGHMRLARLYERGLGVPKSRRMTFGMWATCGAGQGACAKLGLRRFTLVAWEVVRSPLLAAVPQSLWWWNRRLLKRVRQTLPLRLLAQSIGSSTSLRTLLDPLLRGSAAIGSTVADAMLHLGSWIRSFF